MFKVLAASNNKHKIIEINTLLQQYDVLAYTDIMPLVDVFEDGSSFAENAIKKAKTIYDCIPQSCKHQYIVLADDSGICVDALNGEPGIFSARYAGIHGDNADVANNELLISKMRKHGLDKSPAHFVCAIALYSDGHIKTAHGYVHGHVYPQERGHRGFGYDPLFIPDGHTQSFAEMSAEEKNRISHRYRAMVLAEILLRSFKVKS